MTDKKHYSIESQVALVYIPSLLCIGKALTEFTGESVRQQPSFASNLRMTKNTLL